MAKSEYLMLAHKYNPNKHGIGGWFLSEKLDGMRCFWDGGISRGIPKKNVPYANTLKDKQEQIATGLWSRYGNVIHAPDYWLDDLPTMPLDGELYIRGYRQRTMSIIKRLSPDEKEWEKVKYYCFDIPSLTRFFQTRKINIPNLQLNIDSEECHKFRNTIWAVNPYRQRVFKTAYSLLEQFLASSPRAVALYQRLLPFNTTDAQKIVQDELVRVTESGGEGLMLRRNEEVWVPERVYGLLKVKSFDDDEAKVVGYVTGRKTDKGSKLLGKVGALIVEWKGKRFELSGLTDEERRLNNKEWAEENPGEECPESVESIYFPRGTIVTFMYRGLSKDGIPQEARYWRKDV